MARQRRCVTAAFAVGFSNLVVFVWLFLFNYGGAPQVKTNKLWLDAVKEVWEDEGASDEELAALDVLLTSSYCNLHIPMNLAKVCALYAMVYIYA